MLRAPSESSVKRDTATDQSKTSATISLPKGGGAIKGIGEKFAVSSVTGTGSLSVPIFASPGRSGFSPQLSLNYDSGSGNGPFGFGWHVSVPEITRKTDKGLPRYQDEDESDVFILSGAEDLVPDAREFFEKEWNGSTYSIRRYHPRIDGLFAGLSAGEVRRVTSIGGQFRETTLRASTVKTLIVESQMLKINLEYLVGCWTEPTTTKATSSSTNTRLKTSSMLPLHCTNLIDSLRRIAT
jgi:hypothetical protein